MQGSQESVVSLLCSNIIVSFVMGSKTEKKKKHCEIEASCCRLPQSLPNILKLQCQKQQQSTQIFRKRPMLLSKPRYLQLDCWHTYILLEFFIQVFDSLFLVSYTTQIFELLLKLIRNKDRGFVFASKQYCIPTHIFKIENNLKFKHETSNYYMP